MNAVPKLSEEARAVMGLKPEAQVGGKRDLKAELEWVLAHGRSISAGLRLVLHEADEICISAKNGWITPEQAAYDLAKLERLQVYVASIFLLAEHGEAVE
jgi:hypothetical protein